MNLTAIAQKVGVHLGGHECPLLTLAHTLVGSPTLLDFSITMNTGLRAKNKICDKKHSNFPVRTKSCSSDCIDYANNLM